MTLRRGPSWHHATGCQNTTLLQNKLIKTNFLIVAVSEYSGRNVALSFAFDYKQISVNNISDYDGNSQLRTKQKIKVPSWTEKQKHLNCLFKPMFGMWTEQYFPSPNYFLNVCACVYRQALPIHAMPPLHKGFYYKTTTANRSFTGNEHLDFTTCITVFSETCLPPPKGTLQFKEQKKTNTPWINPQKPPLLLGR